MNLKTPMLCMTVALLATLAFAPGAAAAAASCSQAIVVGTGAACAGARTIGCSDPIEQCWIGTYCSVSGNGLLGCVGPAGAQCGPNVGGCSGYGGFYLPPNTPSFTYVYSCTATGYGTNVRVSC